MDGEETIPPEGGSSALRPFPYPIPYPLPIYSDHKGTDILSPSDRDRRRGDRPSMEDRVTGGNPIRDPRTFYLLSVVCGTYKGNESNRMETERDRDYSGTDGEGR